MDGSTGSRMRGRCERDVTVPSDVRRRGGYWQRSRRRSLPERAIAHAGPRAAGARARTSGLPTGREGRRERRARGKAARDEPPFCFFSFRALVLPDEEGDQPSSAAGARGRRTAYAMLAGALGRRECEDILLRARTAGRLTAIDSTIGRLRSGHGLARISRAIPRCPGATPLESGDGRKERGREGTGGSAIRSLAIVSMASKRDGLACVQRPLTTPISIATAIAITITASSRSRWRGENILPKFCTRTLVMRTQQCTASAGSRSSRSLTTDRPRPPALEQNPQHPIRFPSANHDSPSARGRLPRTLRTPHTYECGQQACTPKTHLHPCRHALEACMHP